MTDHVKDELHWIHGPTINELTSWVVGEDGTWVSDIAPVIDGRPLNLTVGNTGPYEAGTCEVCDGPVWIDKRTGAPLPVGP